jgi:hypothetical protein
MSTTATETQIDLRQAVKTAVKFFTESFGLARPSDAQLEEIEMSEDGRFWLITVGYDNPTAVNVVKGKFVLPHQVPLRKYKVVKVDAQDGQPVSIKIRPGL